MEQWKDIPGFEGSYQISDLGNLRSLDRYIHSSTGQIYFMKGINIKLGKDTKGYYRVTLHVEGGDYSRAIHRLVADAFLSNPENKPTVNHKDGNRLNNHVDNLEWATYSEQNAHIYRVLKRPHPKGMLGKIGLVPGKKGAESPRARRIICVDTGKIYGSITDAKNELKLNHIPDVLSGKRSHTGGLKFKCA